MSTFIPPGRHRFGPAPGIFLGSFGHQQDGGLRLLGYLGKGLRETNDKK